MGYSDDHIEMIVLSYNSVLVWYFVGFYRHLLQSCRFLSWRLVDNLSSRSSFLILIAIEWNQIIDSYEKKWGMVLKILALCMNLN